MDTTNGPDHVGHAAIIEQGRFAGAFIGRRPGGLACRCAFDDRRSSNAGARRQPGSSNDKRHWQNERKK